MLADPKPVLYRELRRKPYCRTRQQQAVLPRPVESAVAAPVAVVHQPVQGRVAAPDRHLQGVQGQVGAQVAGQLPADDQPRERIDDQGGVDEPRPGPHIGQIGNPELVRTGRAEVALHQVSGSWSSLVVDGGAGGLAAHHPGDAQLTHEPLDGAAGDLEALAAQLPPDLAGAVDLVVVVEDPPDLELELGITPVSG
jgi:hypothetical protein